MKLFALSAAFLTGHVLFESSSCVPTNEPLSAVYATGFAKRGLIRAIIAKYLEIPF